ncbi:MAG: hypothetical protein K2N63_11200 [Lachnospiraceae bacterium]|nr:hypothetical protein [Lachnospiraceae bacterium]
MEDTFYGLDLNWDTALLSRFNTRTREPEPVCYGKDNQELAMPVILGRRDGDGGWLYGAEAVRAAAHGEAAEASGLLEGLLSGRETLLCGETYCAELLMEEYMRYILTLIRQAGGEKVTLLAVTLPEGAGRAKALLAGIFGHLGLAGHIIFLSHTECFMRYIVNMKPELFLNDTALFACDGTHFFYDRVCFARKRQLQSVLSERKDFTQEYYEGGICGEEAERKSYWFYNMVVQQLSSQPVTSIFVTGAGFADGWAMEALKKLCDGRRVFYGQNLFARGACYAASMHQSAQEYVFLGEDMTREDIMLKAYHDAKEQYFVLSQAGSDYRSVSRTLRFILDDTNEIEFLVDHVMRREPLHEVMILDHLMQRENKTVRLELSLFYVDRDTPVVQIRDIGFGREKTTYRIWEQVL